METNFTQKNKGKVADRLIDSFSELKTNGTGAPLIDLENNGHQEEEKNKKMKNKKMKLVLQKYNKKKLKK